MRSQTKAQYIWNNERGVVLVVALMVMGLLSALAAAYSTTIRSDTVLSGAAGRDRRGFYAAEAGLNQAMQEVKGNFDNFTPPADYEKTIPIGTGTHQRSVTFNLAAVPGMTPGAISPIPAGQQFAGLNAVPSMYTVTSTARKGSDAEATLGAQFQINSIPIFQFLGFYNNDLELQPGAQMIVSGRLHTNGNMTLGTAANTLDIIDSASNPYVSVTAVGSINQVNCNNTVRIDYNQDTSPADGSLDGPRPLACGSPVSAGEIAAYLGTVATGTAQLQVPPVSQFQRGPGNPFWDRSDLRVVLNTTAARLTGNFCSIALPNSGGVNGLLPIEVQTAGGARDAARTASLWQFMCERRGAIFYNELPNNNARPVHQNAYNPAAANDAGNQLNYAPNFFAANRVYRRVGEDTNGDGVLNNLDSNFEICPGGPNPWWVTATHPCNLKGQGAWWIDSDYRRGGFYNRREQRWVLMLNVNIRALIEWNRQMGNPLFNASDTTDGGLVFFLSVQATDSGGIPANHRYGVRVFDSADLDTRNLTFPTFTPGTSDPTGLTVISDQAAYVQGNYNYYPGQPAGQKSPAAIMADTINVLSQGWEVPVGAAPAPYVPNDRKGAVQLNGNSGRNRNVPTNDGGLVAGQNCGTPQGPGNCNSFTTATALGINAAFLGNNDLTQNPACTASGSNYSGGMENYPRFHEQWSGRTLNYRGSFVSIGTPQHASGKWCGTGDVSQIYNPPARAWNYDSAFNDVRLLPPLTPTVNFVQQNRYTRFYE